MTLGGDLVLLPRPRHAALDRGRLVSVAPAAERHTVDASVPIQGYRLRIDSGPGGHGGAAADGAAAEGTVEIGASDEAGRFYGQATLAQLRRLDERGRLPVGTVEDWPDYPVRGVMLDISRCKVPRIETLYSLVDRLASWKVNHLELYMEHTFAYRNHETAWQESGAFDARDLADLHDYCSARHVSLVPNQNTLGHMERWLVHERYSALGIVRGLGSGPLGMPMPASTLDPAHAGSSTLVGALLDELCRVVPGSMVHVGLDEPWDLPAERTAEWRQWLLAIRRMPAVAGRELLVWGDMLAAHPELLADWPAGVTVCEWGYEADHPFDARLETLQAAGVPRWVSPGTSSWMSILGRTTNSLTGCRAAIAAGLRHGAGGVLVTDWGDFGHLQYLPVSDPAFAAAAAYSWCAETNASLGVADIAVALDRHCYEDAAGLLGGAITGLGDAHSLQPTTIANLSALVLHLYFPQLPRGLALGESTTSADLDVVEAAIDEAQHALAGARPANEHGRLAVAEMATSARLVLLLCRDLRARLAGDGTLASVPDRARLTLAQELDDLVGEHRRHWTARNRLQGLQESCAWLEHLGDCYRRGEADDTWAGPLVERIRRRDDPAVAATRTRGPAT